MRNGAKTLSLFVIFIIFLTGGIVIYKKNRIKLLVAEVATCNSTSKELKFSCYRKTIEKYYRGDLKGFYKEVIKDERALNFKGKEDASYAIFGTNCHSFYHAAGDFIATNIEPKSTIESAVNYCTTACTSGCVMGLYKRVALDRGYSEDLLRQLYAACPSESNHQCAHEIGHILHDKYTYSTLKVIDKISTDNYGLKPAKNYSYTTYPNEKKSLELPFEVCNKLLPDGERSYCYTGIGHNLFMFSEFAPGGFKTQYKECSALVENKENCYSFLVYRIGINDAAVKFIQKNIELGNHVCQTAVDDVLREDPTMSREELLKHCYRGVGGGIGLYVDSEFTNTYIDRLDKTTVGDRLKPYGLLCESVDIAYIRACYEGLLGTRYKKLYMKFKMNIDWIDKILPELEKDKSNFEVVG